MFTPPFCPYRECSQHGEAEPRFFQRHGYYKVQCRGYRIPRFRCKTCRRTFSRQTFRVDRYDHKPEVNIMLVMLLCSGIGLRQCARIVKMTLRNVMRKARKLGIHCRLLNRNLEQPLPADIEALLDELETYETRRNTMPLTLAALIEGRYRLFLGLRAAPIRPSGKMTEERKKAIAEDEARYGRRPSRSRAAVRSVLRRAARMCKNAPVVRLDTDEKSTYPNLAKEVFGEDRLVHRQTPGSLARGTWNPLFAINHTEAVMRDLIGRLRRESWLVSKKRCFLNLHLQMYQAFRNFVRPRFNGERVTPAMLAGWMKRPLRVGQLLSWRQDFGRKSGHPLSTDAQPIAEVCPAI